MTPPVPVCLLLTCDPKLAQQLARSAGGMATIRATADRAEWVRACGTPVLLLLDLRHPEADVALAASDPDARHGLIAFGVPESEPFLACSEAGVFALEPLEVPMDHLRRILGHALILHQTREELSLLRQQVADHPAPPPPAADEPALNLAPLHELWRASRHFHDIQKLLDQLVDGVAAAGRIARVGVFARLQDETDYRLWAGLRCLDNAAALSFGPADAFPHWLERHAHLVCRAHLPHVDDLRDRRLLQRVLEETGAEIIVPLLGKRGLIGWYFVGHRATGLPYTPRDLSDLTIIGEQIATLLENATLVEELAVQKTLAENLLETIPTGIVAVSQDGLVRWFNRAAEQILGVTAAETVNRPVEQAGGRVADLALQTIRDGVVPAPVVWTDPASRRTIRANAHRIGADGAWLGAMLLVSDISGERLLREKQEELERHAFWNDLAAALSHEVRNPLVAISTFAQLLPERHTDPEFRQQFFTIVTGEVTRLNAIITQINAFAHPHKPAFRKTDPVEIAIHACALAAKRTAPDKLAVVRAFEPKLPLLSADADALADALAQLLINAHEAVCGRPFPLVSLTLRCSAAEEPRALVFAVTDNGPGIPPEMQEKLFSPFSTTKPRGLGLGLPLARRAAVDHGGRIDVASTPQGTTVTLTLPLEGRLNHAETTADC